MATCRLLKSYDENQIKVNHLNTFGCGAQLILKLRILLQLADKKSKGYSYDFYKR